MLFAFFNQNLAVVILNLRDNRSRDCTYITISVPMITQSQCLLLLVYFILWHFSLNIIHNSPSTDEPLIDQNQFEMAFILPFSGLHLSCTNYAYQLSTWLDESFNAKYSQTIILSSKLALSFVVS